MPSDTYPDNTRPPLHPALRGIATVRGLSTETETSVYTVNFDNGECDCQHGAAWKYTKTGYKPATFCAHKLKATASLIEKTDDESLYDFFETQVGLRYNPFVAVSAFHKELRRGDIDAALYWATVLIPHRGRHGIIAYLRNILFEETRDLQLGKYLLMLSDYGKSVSTLQVQRAIRWFCRSVKKWEMPWRLDIFLDEQRGYKLLADKYTYDVAKPRNIIPAADRTALVKKMLSGFATGNRVDVQYGLKGLAKCTATDNDKAMIETFHVLIDVANGDQPNKFKHDSEYASDIYEYVNQRVLRHGAIGYHDVNAFADALTGEPRETTLSAIDCKLMRAFPKTVRAIPLAPIKRVPLYANDNHTYEGKALMARYRSQLEPRAEQTDIDFRLCGAYMGVGWRMLAFKQHMSINCKWSEVSWATPNWLWSHLDAMWY